MNTGLILIILIPLAEIYLFIKIGSQIGAFNTISLILLTALLGVWYARYEGFNTLKSGLSQIIKNELPLYEIISGAALALAAFLLIFPVFATVFICLFLIFPPSRKLILYRFYSSSGTPSCALTTPSKKLVISSILSSGSKSSQVVASTSQESMLYLSNVRVSFIAPKARNSREATKIAWLPTAPVSPPTKAAKISILPSVVSSTKKSGWVQSAKSPLITCKSCSFRCWCCWSSSYCHCKKVRLCCFCF